MALFDTSGNRYKFGGMNRHVRGLIGLQSIAATLVAYANKEDRKHDH